MKQSNDVHQNHETDKFQKVKSFLSSKEKFRRVAEQEESKLVISKTEKSKNDKDQDAKLEEIVLNNSQQDYKHEQFVQTIEQRLQDLHNLRIGSFRKLYWLGVAWICAVVVIVVSVGLNWLTLSDAVLIALMGTMSVSVLGLVGIGAKWLFPDNKK